MPAAAVIPAPVAYIKVVAVKSSQLDFWFHRTGLLPQGRVRRVLCTILLEIVFHPFTGIDPRSRSFTLKKLECSKQARAVNTLAWNNNLGLGILFCWFSGSK